MQLFKSFNLAAILAMASAGQVFSQVPARRSNKRNGRGAPGAYGRGLRNAITAKAAAKLAQRPGLRDESGAYTCTGALLTLIDVQPGPGYHEAGGASGPDGFAVTCRRKWLAGISAQRGY